ncbi:DJ-1/PfpI family protein, partial [Streptomyces sp. S6]
MCSGAAVLGEAGLLDGRARTTHWSLTAAMRARYPAARVREPALYVHDGRISTSAGIASGIDLALYLRRDGDTAHTLDDLAARPHPGHPARVRRGTGRGPAGDPGRHRHPAALLGRPSPHPGGPTRPPHRRVRLRPGPAQPRRARRPAHRPR